MKKAFYSLICLMLVCLLTPAALAEDGGAAALSGQELMDWVAQLTAQVEELTPLNAPITEEALTEDGYAYLYEFGTLYFDKPTLEQATLNALVVNNEETPALRDVPVGSYVTELLNAYYNENPDLMGNEDFATLYAVDTLPSSALWAWVQRSGQQVGAVQYAVHEQTAHGQDGYTDCGVVYTLEDGFVTAISVYGLNAVITAEEAAENLAFVKDVQQQRAYHMYPTSFIGTDLPVFERDDLLFSGNDFLSITPEEAITALGQCLEDTWMDDDGAYLRTMTFANAILTFAYDGNKNLENLAMLTIDGAGLEGPRGARVGETISNVLMRFRHSEGEYDGQSREILYGDGEKAPTGTAEYGDNASATLRYMLALEDGREVVLQMEFYLNALTEIIIYYW